MTRTQLGTRRKEERLRVTSPHLNFNNIPNTYQTQQIHLSHLIILRESIDNCDAAKRKEDLNSTIECNYHVCHRYVRPASHLITSLDLHLCLYELQRQSTNHRKERNHHSTRGKALTSSSIRSLLCGGSARAGRAIRWTDGRLALISINCQSRFRCRWSNRNDATTAAGSRAWTD